MPATGRPQRASTARRLFLTAVLAAVAALAVAACGGSSGGGSSSNNGNSAASNYGTVLCCGTLPSAGTPTKGGTITVGQITGSTPTYIFPIIPGADTSTPTIEFMSALYLPLYNGPKGARPEVDYNISVASGPPQASNGNKTFTIPLRTNLKWANGAPITANDMIFEIDLLKAAVKESPANWGQYAGPTSFPLNVTSATAPNPHTLVINLKQPLNEGYFLYNQIQDTNNVFPLPSTAWNVDSAGGAHLSNWQNPAVAKKIYDYLNKAGGSVSTFASNPLWKDVSGPFKLQSFSATNSSYTLVPNPAYNLTPKPTATISVQTFTSTTAELNALKTGSLDVGGLDPSQLPQAPALKQAGYSVFGGPGWGWFGAIYNFKDTANHFDKIISQQYARAALAHLVNQPAIIKGVYKGAAVPSYGPVPSAPTSPYTPTSATTPPYTYSPSAAVSLLKSHGWKVVPNGQTTCQKAGTAPTDCGAGIPAGTPFKFVWADLPQSASTTGALESEALASEAKAAAGINITLQTKTFNFLTANYNDQNPAAAKYTNDWGANNYGGLYMDYYPTQFGIFSPGGGFNLGDYNDNQANNLMNASVHSANINAVKTEADYLAKNPPVLFFPNPDIISVVSKRVGGSPDSFLILTQQAWAPQYWYVKK
ncbi:MAG TPA: ABC transporter substrate-binding protein [Solirubrobacteraceae bacterium]|nr:ABC transporter substrate-binding protein [Solirubrobacteraceae bacterium]